MAGVRVITGPDITLARQEEQTWWFTHSDFHRAVSIVPALGISRSTSVEWGDDEGFFGEYSEAEIVRFWLEEKPTLISRRARRTEPVSQLHGVGFTTVLVHFRNRGINPTTVKPRFLVAYD